MSSKEKVYCDRCEEVIGEYDYHASRNHMSWCEDRNMDAAGSMDNVHYSADLCDGCLREFSYWLAKKINERFPGTLLKAFMETKHARRT